MSDELLNEAYPLRDSGLSNGVDNEELPVHRWYPFKEAFSPRLVERAVSESAVNKNDKVLDPFCGSGTVPLVAAHLGATGVGVEVNPFMAFVSRTKLLRIAPATLRRALPRILRATKRGEKSPLERFSTFSSAGGAEKWLFNPSVLRAFEGAWSEAGLLSPETRDLVRLALLAAALDVCNAKRDGKCLRYKPDWSNLRFDRRAFSDAFETRVRAVAEDLDAATRPPGAARIALGDSRRDLAKAFRSKFKLCLTSPPYLNSFDYSDVYRPELFLGKFVSSNEELRALRFKTVRSHVQVDWARPVRDDFGALYTECVAELRERSMRMWNRRLPQMVQAYFEDMNGVLRWLRKYARDDAKLWIVVSTSAYAGVEIPVDLILGELGSRAGWCLREVGVLRYLRTSGQHWNEWSTSEKGKPRLRESAIIFDALPPARRRRSSVTE